MTADPGSMCASLTRETATAAPATALDHAHEQSEESASRALLDVRGLTVSFFASNGATVPAVKDASFAVGAGEGVGLIGESGCGKSTTALALGRLLPPHRCLVQGSVQFRHRDLLSLSEKEIEGVRGAEIAFVFQEPALALHPFQRVGEQVADVIRVHRRWNRQRCREEAEEVLSEVNLGESERIFAAYPHQLSGGQRQRVVIALALACKPALLVADEPTASLDATTQAEILNLFRKLRERHGIALLLITHNPAILSGLADRVLVMYAGRIVEGGAFEQVIRDPLHPYTDGLLHSLPEPPRQNPTAVKQPLPVIAGSPPDLMRLPPGCAFAPRCSVRMEICSEREPERVTSHGLRDVRCFHYGG
jgi:peptide/nickel transport system ATP-binding protein